MILQAVEDRAEIEMGFVVSEVVGEFLLWKQQS